MKRAIIILVSVVMLLSAVGCAARVRPAEAKEEVYYVEEEYYVDAAEAPTGAYYEERGEEYGKFEESTFLTPDDRPLSTFSVDVDTASYSNVRRMLLDGYMPDYDAVRVEEFINYFSYDYDGPYGDDPIAIGVDIAPCPWNDGRALARIAVQAEKIDLSDTLDSNLVFLLDVSGSMDDPDKLPLVKKALLMLSDNLKGSDTVSIVVYAGSSGVVLDGCRGDNKYRIEDALDSLYAGGSTAGGEGIKAAYRLAERHFKDGQNNRVILCTDGDFNVGVSSTRGLENLIEEKRESGVFLSVLGFGTGNIKDNKMETLADKGNGNYAYIDSLLEAKKVLVSELNSTLYTIAKDVKIQVEFNPNAVKEYRLIGYDNRRLKDEDFNDDKKDAGEMGAGHCVTVMYELVLQNSDNISKDIDDLVFSDDEDKEEKPIAMPEDWLYVKARYKHPDENTSRLITRMAGQRDYTDNPDNDFVFASAVTEFAMLLKDSEYAGDASYYNVLERARGAKGEDRNGYRAQFVQLVELAKELDD